MLASVETAAASGVKVAAWGRRPRSLAELARALAPDLLGDSLAGADAFERLAAKEV